MTGIRPEIEAFWQELGYEPGARNVVNQVFFTVWKGYDGIIIAMVRDNSIIQYQYDGKLLSEDEMLRWIKLSAFV